MFYLKNVWTFFTQNDNRSRELQKNFDEECNYLDNLIAKEKENNIRGDDGNEDLNNRNEGLNKEIKQTECSKRRGTITRLDSDHGFIDHCFFFDIKVAANLTSELKQGCEVDFLLYRNPRTEHLKVIKIEGVVDHYWDTNENLKENETGKEADHPALQYYSTSQRNISGMIVGVIPKGVIVETEYDTFDLDLNEVKKDFEPKEGDRVYLSSKVQSDEGYVDRHGEILEILAIFPARILTDERCTVTTVNDDWGVLNDNCYITFDILPNDTKLTVGDIVNADIIECERGKFSWRCINFTMIQKCEGSEKTAGNISSQQNGNHMVIVSEDQVCVFGGLDQEQTVSMTVLNNCHRTMIANGINFKNQHSRSAMVSLIDTNIQNGFEVASKSTVILHFRVKSKFFGESREFFVIDFGSFRIKRSIIIKVCEDEDTAQKLREKNAEISFSSRITTASRHNPSRYYANKVWSKEKNVIPGVSLIKKRRFIANRIPSNDVPMRLRTAYLSDERRSNIIENIESMYSYLKEELSYQNYVQRFKTLMHLEEIECFYNFRNYDRERAHFKHEREYLALYIDNLSEKRPSLAIGDVVNAINPFVENSPTYQGFIHKVLGDKILLKFNASFHSSYRNEDYRLEFFFSRFTYRKCHFAIERAVKNLGEKFLFPLTVATRKSPALNLILDKDLNMYLNDTLLEWFNPRLNEIQRRAVCNILRGETFNMPYVVFGPPGTGKTVTLVETILQLLKNIKSARIMVATPSNSSANLISTRLIDSGKVCPGDFVRLVSQNLIEQDLIPEHLMPYSATVDVGIEGTCQSEMKTTESGLKLRCQMKYLGRHKITIGTCTTLGNYMLLNFPPDHFSHIIVDEAGQCLEPEIMIPLSQVTRNSGRIVLAGDPHQLQAPIVNRYADDRGLKFSFLERILNRSPYRKDNKLFPNTCGFDPLLVTKLLYNYRSLPSILKVYSDFFYDSELIPAVNEDSPRGDMLNQLLPGLFSDSNERPKSHGAFFIGIRGENAQDEESPSWYNSLEARNVFSWTVKLYRQKISSQNIGIITPYTRQVKYLRNMFLTAGVEVPKIGTVEEFQGQERDVILISTVRSSVSQVANDLKYSLGFVRSKKRMNVAISRARCLLIVFGNPHLLYQDPYWHKYIKYCIVNNAYEGCDLPECFNTIVD